MYRFRVTAYNDAGPSEPGEPSDPVVIDVPGVQIAPYFVLMLNDTIALEHEKVEFAVKVLGTPKPSVQWFKDDMEVFASDRLEIRTEEDGGSVVVRDVRLSDCGNIKCVATNILGRATSVAQLVIEGRLEGWEGYYSHLTVCLASCPQAGVAGKIHGRSDIPLRRGDQTEGSLHCQTSPSDHLVL